MATAVAAAMLMVFAAGRQTCVFAFVIVAVESCSDEDDSCSGTDFAAQRIFSAFRTGFQMFIIHVLEFLKFMSAFLADVFVGWHGFLSFEI